MGQFNLPFFVGEEKSFGSLQNAEASALKSRGVFARANAFATGLDADHAHRSILQERMKKTDRVAAPAHTGNKQIGQAFLALENLAARFDADDTLETPHHHRVWMRAENGTQSIMSGAHVG